MIKNYRKKHVVVQAVKLERTPESVKACCELVRSGTRDVLGARDFDKFFTVVCNEGMKIETLEGVMTADIGDYIIKGVKGECYPCKPDIFHMTYEEISEDSLN